MRARPLVLITAASFLLLSACADDGTEAVVPSAAAKTDAQTPTATATADTALERYCRHARDTDAHVQATNREGYQDESKAYYRGLEMERLLSADAGELRRRDRTVEATKVADHATATRQVFDGWLGRGPNPGRDILQEYDRASGPARSMCPS